MATRGVAPVLVAALLAIAALPHGARAIGVCYGVLASVRPPASDVVQMYRSNGINNMRIYFADTEALNALSGSNIGVIMDIDNQNLAKFAQDRNAVDGWVRDNIQAFQGVNFRYIAVGNEIDGSDRQFILPAMQNVRDALAAAGLGGSIKVSTAVKMDVFDNTSPPSNGVFKDPGVFSPIVRFLAENGAPLLANVYPYFAYKDNDIELNFALFQPSSTTVNDNGRIYNNLFDAMVDAVRAAMEKVGGSGVDVLVSESGWPSDGGAKGASVDNARTYNQNLINHAGQGTPKKPGAMEVYVFAMFDEDRKNGAEIEKHFGLFNPVNKSPVYPINF